MKNLLRFLGSMVRGRSRCQSFFKQLIAQLTAIWVRLSIQQRIVTVALYWTDLAWYDRSYYLVAK
jgi:hypothetical protein